MRAVRLVAPGDLRVEEVPDPVAGPGEVVLAVGGAGLCHSDLHVRHLTEEVIPLPLTLGHEIAGSVVSLGPGVVEWSEGERAVVHLVWACGACPACRRGDDNVCHAAGRGAQPPAPGLGPAGGMADLVVVPARHLVRLDRLDPVQAAPLADAGMTSHHALRNSAAVLRPGATAVVIGVGGLGHVMVQLLRELTGCRVVAVDRGEDRLDLARGLGAHRTIDAEDGDVATAVLELTSGRGAEAFFDFVGADATVDAVARGIAPDGIAQLTGIGGGVVPLVAEPRFGLGWPWGASLRSSYGGTMADLEACVALAEAGRLRVETETFDLGDALTAFDRLEQGTIRGRAVLVP